MVLLKIQLKQHAAYIDKHSSIKGSVVTACRLHRHNSIKRWFNVRGSSSLCFGFLPNATKIFLHSSRLPAESISQRAFPVLRSFNCFSTYIGICSSTQKLFGSFRPTYVCGLVHILKFINTAWLGVWRKLFFQGWNSYPNSSESHDWGNCIISLINWYLWSLCLRADISIAYQLLTTCHVIDRAKVIDYWTSRSWYNYGVMLEF